MPPADLVRLALALISAEQAVQSIRHRLLACARDRDQVQAGAFDLAHQRAVERRDRADERMRAAYLVLAKHHAPFLVALVASASS